ncbi:MAG: hypothetical protein U0172_06280 [Nitrospiraceae bacterium]
MAQETSSSSTDNSTPSLKDRVFERSTGSTPKRVMSQHHEQAPIYLMITLNQAASPSLIYIPAPTAPAKPRKKT